ncbi:unnamed protein product [Acanthoscelides obtectus]|uniref:Uncharacterized protein n=1 Tax=Acanthoscelides obtectus TaxID=200917 RepID=A0A9P0PS23_ACAOB|nr:unnamed protein product [Acanthoscelides obtectus]CAH2003787.1 unnamed protein product [Acanthoscelides obtectus]CAK1639270.1 hypothetical protein AOBTE_LOCUS11083 [Acanthoscelides obtectus]CAK1639294.1 hypothetical protein AOBTE_LOCUS11107 [Acanthoscelides obtectus]
MYRKISSMMNKRGRMKGKNETNLRI